VGVSRTGSGEKIRRGGLNLKKRAALDGIQVGFFQTPIHAGTHLDAPRHVLPEGVTLDDVDLGTFIGEAYCVDISQIKPNEEVSIAMLEPYADKIKKNGIVFLYSGWNEKMFGTLEYWNDSPVLGLEAAQWLADKGVKLLGYDFFQDAGAKGYETHPENFKAHKIILGNKILHIEHLTNLSKVVGTEFFAIALPLKIVGAEGSPTRVIALR